MGKRSTLKFLFIALFFELIAIGGFAQTLTGIDLGYTDYPGSDTLTSKGMIVNSAGGDLGWMQDICRFVYMENVGDAEMSVKVASQTWTHEWAKCGLLIREKLTDQFPKMVYLALPGNKPIFEEYIPEEGGSGIDYTTFGKGQLIGAPNYLKLKRTGDKFKGYESKNGTSWTPIGEIELPMSNKTYIGLFVSSHETSIYSRVEFEDIWINGEQITKDPTGISDFNTSKASIYPNPLKSGNLKLNLSSIKSKYVDLIVSDITGKIIYTNKYKGGSEYELSRSLFDSGIYFVKLSDDNLSKTLKIIIQ